MRVPLGGIACSVTSALIWGCYPWLGRYLQTREEGQPSAVAVLSAVTITDTVLLAAFMAFLPKVRAESHASAH